MPDCKNFFTDIRKINERGRTMNKRTFSKTRKTLAKLLTAALFVGALQGYALNDMQTVSAAKKANVKVKLNKKKLSLKKGKTYKLKVKKNPAKARLSWKSSRPGTVSVNKKGKIKARKAGKATITVTARYKGLRKKATCKVTVKANTQKTPDTTSQKTPSASPSSNASATPAAPTGSPTPSPTPTNSPRPSKKPSTPTPTPVTIAYKADYELELGDKLDTKTKVTPAEGVIDDYTVTTTNEYVASVDANGVVTTNHIGKCLLVLTSKTDETKKETYKLCVTDYFIAPDGFNIYKEDIAHGEVKDFYYPSQYRESGEGHAKIYFPPNYDPESKKYNVLFCLHGGGQDENFWTLGRPLGQGGCHAQYILDTLYVSPKMPDVIVVFPNGDIKYDKNKTYPHTVPDPTIQNSWSNCYLFEYEVIYDLLPYMQENYPIEKGADHTGVCGLSMGCGEAIELGLKHPDLFHYMGFFSAGPFASVNQTIVTTEEAAERINEEIKLCFFITGERDRMMDDSARRFVNNCDALGMNSMFFEVAGTGHDDGCWDRALYAFMKHAFR